MVRLTDIAWAAGVYEGEGSAYRRSGRYPTVQMNMTDEDVMQKFASIMPVGRLYGPYQHGRSTVDRPLKPFWRWQAHGEAVRTVRDMFSPWLGERRLMQFQTALGE